MANSGASHAGSGGSSKSSFVGKRERTTANPDNDQGDNLLDRRSSLEYGIFGVLFTLSKEKSEHRIIIRWVLLKVLLDGWQLFTTIISPQHQAWSIDYNGTAWKVIGVLNFYWLGDVGYGAYLAVLYSMMALLAVNIAMCVWVAWCFKEHKFPVVWPIKVLRVFSSVFFQAFDVASLNLLQLGIMCRFTGNEKPHLHFDLFPKYSCMASPHIMHAVISALCLGLFVSIALLLNMAEVEVNPLSRRPMALGHSGAEVMAFAIKVLLTLVNVFIGWNKVEACMYLALSLALAWQTLRWSPHLVSWVNFLKAGVSATVVWCSGVLMLLVFHPGVKHTDLDKMKSWSDSMTYLMLAGLSPAFGIGALMSWALLRRMTKLALKGLQNPKKLPLMEVFTSIDEPRDVEIVARCCRVWKEPGTLDPEAVHKAHQIIKAGLEMFPNCAYMVLLHANFMIDVLGVAQSGSRRIEDARKLNPSLMCRFIMFVRQQQATQNAAGSSMNSNAMDLLGYVEYQRKQRMVVRLHREALQAMCNFWKALDASSVSFTHLSKSLGKIESSVSQAQRAYRVVLESYGNNPKLVHLYGRFLQTIKNDPWHAAEYFAEAERLEEVQDTNASGPLMPDGTPLSRMDEIDTAVLVLNATGEVQMANRHTQFLFGYKRGVLEGKPLAMLMAPHYSRRLAERLVAISSAHDLLFSSNAEDSPDIADEMVVGLHSERLAFPAKLCLRKASGVGEDSTIIALIEPVPPVHGVSSLWVTNNGIITACDPSFVSNFGWKASEINGTSIKGLLTFVAQQQPLPPVPMAGAGPLAGALVTPRRHSSHTTSAVPRQNESASAMIKRLLTQASAPKTAPAEAYPEAVDITDRSVMCTVSSSGADGGVLPGLVPHKYVRKATSCSLTIVPSAAKDSPIVHEIRMKLDTEPVQLLAVNRKGAILHASADLAARLKDRSSSRLGGLMDYGYGSNIGQEHAGGHLPAQGEEVLAGDTASTYTAPLHGYTLFDFLAPAWKDMHFKLLKETTVMSPLPVAELSCRKEPLLGPTLELRTTSGRDIYMRVGVSTTEVQGDTLHIVHMTRSSLDEALAERRVRLQVSVDGLVASVEAGKSTQLLGLEPSKVLGRGMWEIVEDVTPSNRSSNSTILTRNTTTLISRALKYPGYSWRVQVMPPPSRGSRASFTPSAKPAIMQLHVVLPTEDDETNSPSLLVDLWPTSSIVGVLEVDHTGRVRAVLEEKTRPAGLLFGFPSHSLVGTMLGEFIALPLGRTKPGDLLSIHGSKKSSMKAQSQAKEASVKVGPVHKLMATHIDGRPLSLDLQVIGKPGSNDPSTVLLKLPQAPLMPLMLSVPPPQPPPTAVAAAAPPQSGVTPLPPLGPAFTAGAVATSLPPPLSLTSPPPPRSSLERVKSMPAGIPGPDCSNRPGVATALAGTTVPSVTCVGEQELLTFKSQKNAPGADDKKRSATGMTPRRTPSIEDPPLRISSPECHSNTGCVQEPPPSQAPPIVRSLTTPPAAKTFNGTPLMTGDAEYGYLGTPSLTHGVGELEDVDELELEKQEGVTAPRGRFDRLQGGPHVAKASAGLQSTQQQQHLGRSKLADMVKSVGNGASGGAVDCSVSGRPLAAMPVRGGGDFGGGGAGNGDATATAAAAAGPGGGRSLEATGAQVRCGTPKKSSFAAGSIKMPAGFRLGDTYAASEDERDASDGCASVSEHSGSLHDKGVASRTQTSGRVSNWVATKGAYYQNSAAEDSKVAGNFSPGPGDGYDDIHIIASSVLLGGSRSEGRTAGGEEFLASPLNGVRPPARSALGPGMEGLAGDDDDAGSDGGQSAVSGAQSATGSEYTRGKRFRKLAKIMNSAQTQQIQNRLRIHSLVVVGLLAILHCACFVLTVTTIQSQKESMMQLGRSGQAQLFLHRIMIDVRSLDIISHKKWLDNLYTPDDAEFLVERISTDAEQMKIRFNEILNRHPNSPEIIRLFYQTKRTVWDTNDFDGSDIFINATIWDFASRFYTMAKQIKQLYNELMAEGEFIANSYAGQFILKSGPDLFSDSRKILDALLYLAVDNARKVDTLQILFLVLEGAIISFIAACYLMFLLRAVAGQRFKLYGTFLVIPVGLTRALASQNLNLLIDDDEDDDGEDEDERAAQAVIHEAEESTGGGVQQKLRRRATLKIEANDTPQVASPMIGGGGDWNAQRASEMRFGGAIGSTVGGDDPSSRKPPYMDKLDKLQTLTSESAVSMDHTVGGSSWCCSWAAVRSMFRRGRRDRKRRNSIFPLPMSMFIIGGSSHVSSSTTGKRSLRFDSNETVFMLLPFIVWSIMVIAMYAVAVVSMQGVAEVVAVHSVVNFMSARTSRTVFFCQEVANIDPVDAAQLIPRRAALLKVVKLLKDAWYTLQLGSQAYTALGNATERFPLVKSGLSHASPELEKLFYSSGSCQRTNSFCPGPSYRFYQVSQTGLDAMMQQLMISLSSIATNTSMVPEGLEDEHFDFVYNVGFKDILDGTTRIAKAHYDTIIELFNHILVLHIILFLLFWVLFGGFVFFMLNPLLNRVAIERRRIAELMSQLPLELDVERLVARALGVGATNKDQQQSGGGGDGDRSEHGGGGTEGDATSKWKAIIRASSSLSGKAPGMDIRKR